jgi:hypothetical protein
VLTSTINIESKINRSGRGEVGETPRRKDGEGNTSGAEQGRIGRLGSE